jgi:hypothetical protein
MRWIALRNVGINLTLVQIFEDIELRAANRPNEPPNELVDEYIVERQALGPCTDTR